MSYVKEYQQKLLDVTEYLPEDKITELLDFAYFLLNRYFPKSQIDENSLLLQQKSLSKIWDDSEEDLYEL